MRDTAPVFSVVVPTHNRPAQLAVCLQAIAEMSYPRERFEVIVVDDGGTTSLQQIYDSFRSRLELTFLRREQGGPGAARNTGVEHARGRYLAFTDDDCAPSQDWLARLQDRFEQAPDELCGGRTVNGLTQNPYSAASQAVIDVVYSWQPDAADFPQFFASNNLAVPADLFRKIGGFNPAFEVSEDREFCDRWAHSGYRMAYAPEVIICHRHNLSLWTLLKQHFNYGRGARCFHKQREHLGWGRFRSDTSFHVRLLRHGLANPFASTGTTVALLACTQMAIAAGYAWERIVDSEAAREVFKDPDTAQRKKSTHSATARI
ncbi:MAG: glycosyltransferase [Acidobacteriaceae bacterium]|nr:glycosyltransferase [Acidobacteriaceae bacterium]